MTDEIWAPTPSDVLAAQSIQAALKRLGEAVPDAVANLARLDPWEQVPRRRRNAITPALIGPDDQTWDENLEQPPTAEILPAIGAVERAPLVVDDPTPTVPSQSGKTILEFITLGAAQRDRGNLRAALDLFRHALEASEIAGNPDQVIVALANLGDVYRELDHSDAARVALERALRLSEAHLGSDHPAVAVLSSRLGAVQRELGNLSAASDLFRQALSLTSEQLGPHHPAVAVAANNLGAVQRALGDVLGARDLFRRALTISSESGGGANLDVAVALNNLGAVERDLGNVRESSRLWQAGLDILREKALLREEDSGGGSLGMVLERNLQYATQVMASRGNEQSDS